MHGDPATTLASPTSVMLNPTRARRLFGSNNLVGRTLSLTHDGVRRSFTVSAVFCHLPTDSSIDFQMIALISELVEQGTNAFQSWGSASGETFLRIFDPTKAAAITANLAPRLAGSATIKMDSSDRQDDS